MKHKPSIKCLHFYSSETDYNFNLSNHASSAPVQVCLLTTFTSPKRYYFMVPLYPTLAVFWTTQAKVMWPFSFKRKMWGQIIGQDSVAWKTDFDKHIWRCWWAEGTAFWLRKLLRHGEGASPELGTSQHPVHGRQKLQHQLFDHQDRQACRSKGTYMLLLCSESLV